MSSPPAVESIDKFTFEDGSTFGAVPVAYQSWGELNDAGDNCVLVCHALTGNTDVESWWGEMIGPGRALDTERDYIVCANVLASPYGSFSPITRDSRTAQPFAAGFPIPTVRDTVNLHRSLLEKLGVRRVRFCIGGSLGGMQVLEWAFHADLMGALVPIAVGGRHSAWCIAWSEAQRQAIYGDPHWNAGRYPPNARPDLGLAIARMIAMCTYRSFESFDERFGRTVGTEATGDQYAVEGYLHYQGAKLVDRFDANCYVRLTQSMDTHDVARDRGEYFDVLSKIALPCLAVGISSDVLYPLSEQRELAQHMPNAELAVLDAPYGHDSFLIERARLNEIVTDWRRRRIDR
ncbi:MAG TPA: homoserine O-acetyltransferase [Gammaproteobacteria bacterium]|nr:homoserine O-acetyltransferase [Gammaproteobacteria bacterium]